MRTMSQAFSQRAARGIAGALVGAYLAVLAMSAGHLAHWYSLTLGPLPSWVAWGLSFSLEATAFLLSVASNILPGASRWAPPGSAAALMLVWAGNYLSMRRFGEGVHPLEVALQSSFIPVGTYLVGRVIGELLRAGAVEEGESWKKAKALAANLLEGGPKTTALQGMGIEKGTIARAIVAYVAGEEGALKTLSEQLERRKHEL